MKRTLCVGGTLAISWLASGCLGLPPQVPACPAPLVNAANIDGGDFDLRERVRVDARDVDLALDVQIERRADRLVMVGFDPFGARVLSAVQTDVAVDADARIGRALEIDPAMLLADFHAAGRFDSDAPERDAVRREGCLHTTNFVRVERRER